MAKSRKKPKVREDINTLAVRIVQEASGQAPKTPDPEVGKNPAAVALGKLGASKGGKARAAKMTARKRREVAKKAAEARWAKRRHP
jgi:hypothetical protein